MQVFVGSTYSFTFRCSEGVFKRALRREQGQQYLELNYTFLVRGEGKEGAVAYLPNWTDIFKGLFIQLQRYTCKENGFKVENSAIRGIYFCNVFFISRLTFGSFMKTSMRKLHPKLRHSWPTFMATQEKPAITTYEKSYI